MTGVIYQYNIGNKYYVGKTYTQERKRIDKHKYEALTLKKDHPFCKAIRKYGWDAVRESYHVIERHEADSKQELNNVLIEREAYWINKLNSVVPNGYNIYSKGTMTVPHTHNKEEIYAKVSKSLKGKYLNAEQSSKRIYCIEQKKWYVSISEAERQNNIARGGINKAASGVNCKAGGLSWSYVEADTTREDLIKKSRKPIYCIELDKTFPSIYEAAKEIFGEKASQKKCKIQAALKRNNGSTEGLHFEYLSK